MDPEVMIDCAGSMTVCLDNLWLHYLSRPCPVILVMPCGAEEGDCVLSAACPHQSSRCPRTRNSPVTIHPSKSRKLHLDYVLVNGHSNSSHATGQQHVVVEVHHSDLLGTVLDVPDEDEERLLHLFCCFDLDRREVHICDNGAPDVVVVSQLWQLKKNLHLHYF